MNEFTKEELEDIYWNFEYYLECLEPKFGKCKSPRRFNLMNKIKSMIDNYCEHDDYAFYTEYANFCSNCDDFIRFD